MRFVLAICLVACLAQASEASCRLGKFRVFKLFGCRSSVSSCQTTAIQPVRNPVVTTTSAFTCVECQKLAK